MRHLTTADAALRRAGIARLLCMALLVGLGLGVTSQTAHAGTPPNRLDYLGGRVLAHPEIHNLYFDQTWDADNSAALSRSSIDHFTSLLVTSNYLAKAGQYGVGSASFNGSDDESTFDATLCPLPIANNTTEFALIVLWVTCMTQPGPDPFLRPTLTGVPTPDDNSLYVIYLPTGVQIVDPHSRSCRDYSAYHFMSKNLAWQFPTPVTPVLGMQDFAFAVVPADCANGGLDNLTPSASHEILEASTDTTVLTGWIDVSTASSIDNILKAGEAADICGSLGAVPTPSVRLTDGVLVAPYWSNADGMCEPITHQIRLDEIGLPGSVPHTATFDGASVTLPFSMVLDPGTMHSYSFPTPVGDPNPGIRYVTSEPAATVDGTSDVFVDAVYHTQDFLTVQTTPPAAAAADASLTPSGWEAHGSTVTLTTDALIALGGGNRERFDHWSGDASGTSPATMVLMDAPKTATANYVLQHLLTVSTSGLGANTTTITDGATILGTANDTTPLAVWLDDGPLALGASADVSGPDGTQYFFQGFTPAAPGTLSAPFTTTAAYATMAQLISSALASGGIFGSGANGQANAFTHQFAAVQADMGSGNYAQALSDLQSFTSHAQAQSGKHLTVATATTFQLDALLVYHSALCQALASGQINAATAAADYTYYSGLVASLGDTVLPPC